ncbi:MAG TPA: LacI family DNA-binding transcriptional regulator [Lachnospiraceae bacterium]
MNKKPTFQDIADYTNFSKTTISRYFNRPDSLTPENKKIISKALKELNYQENKVARILANGKTEILGLIVPNLYLHYYAEMLNQFVHSYEQYGYKFFVFAGSDHAETEKTYIQELLSYNIEGLIVLSHTVSSKELARLNIPIITIEREDVYTSSVNTDNYLGGVQAVELLEQCNCDTFFFINTVPDDAYKKTIPALKRYDGFVNTCKEKDLEYYTYSRDFGNSYSDMQKAVRIFSENYLPKFQGKTKGFFFSNDTAANIFLNYIIQEYKELPKDFKIVGFDGSPISEQAVIPTSTVAQQIDKIAATSMELMAKLIAQKKQAPEKKLSLTHCVVPPRVIARATAMPDS